MPERDRTPKRFAPAEEYLAITPEALHAEHVAVIDENGLWGDTLYTLDTDSGLATVEVVGPLSSRQLWWWDGYAGSAGVEARIRAALNDPRARAVVLRLDSPGGTVSGLFECLDACRAAKQAAGKPVVALAEGSGAYSAAYALATLADEIVVTRTSGVGSVGVIATAVSYAEALEQQGIAVAVVASGAQKTDLHPALPISDAAKSRLRARVMDLAQLFAEEVARGRDLKPEDVLGQQAAIFHGAGAVASGLADRVGTAADAGARALALADALAAKAAKEKHMSALTDALGLAADATPAQIEERAAALGALHGRLATLTGESEPGAIEAAAAAWKTAHAQVGAMSQELAKLRADSDAAAREKLLQAGRQQGRITPDMEADAEWREMVAAIPTARLDAFVRRLPVALGGETTHKPPKGDPTGAAVSLTDDDHKAIARMGCSEEEYLAAKQARAKTW